MAVRAIPLGPLKMQNHAAMERGCGFVGHVLVSIMWYMVENPIILKKNRKWYTGSE